VVLGLLIGCGQILDVQELVFAPADASTDSGPALDAAPIDATTDGRGAGESRFVPTCEAGAPEFLQSDDFEADLTDAWAGYKSADQAGFPVRQANEGELRSTGLLAELHDGGPNAMSVLELTIPGAGTVRARASVRITRVPGRTGVAFVYPLPRGDASIESLFVTIDQSSKMVAQAGVDLVGELRDVKPGWHSLELEVVRKGTSAFAVRVDVDGVPINTATFPVLGEAPGPVFFQLGPVNGASVSGSAQMYFDNVFVWRCPEQR